MKWIDIRTEEPSTNHFDRYLVVAYDGNIPFLGIGHWMPINNYTEGFWEKIENTNTNNRTGALVLYWMPHPSVPMEIK